MKITDQLADNEISLKMLRYKIASFGVFISAVFLLIVATFPSFFIFDPALIDNSVRLVILLLSTIAWLSIALGPVIVFSLLASGKKPAIHALPFIALSWPIMILVNHLELWISTGNAYMSYLVEFPVFAITDILTPAILIVFWLEYRIENHHLFNRLAAK
ncbi:hypothetical protein [Aurantimicrobium minutum]|uniref:hypothetical protein n=1 Tax=Aurantimicrobium minutum TaxID=708131 RepID=UPI0024742D17|nr:hypothetical protein [Aurantimicrobium minutum]MDH6422825.1 hypothetical protein [Aurantimicrobium minutum]